jgi:hypothetical protein
VEKERTPSVDPSATLLFKMLRISFLCVSCYHCSEYSLEVVCPSNPASQPLAKFALNPYPIHHPDGLDLAVIHLKQEEDSLKLMENLGVEMLYLRDFKKDEPFIGESLNFEGFQIGQMDLVDSQEFNFDEEENWDDDAQNNTDEKVWHSSIVCFPYRTQNKNEPFGYLTITDLLHSVVSFFGSE